jgi:hypothetical protein
MPIHTCTYTWRERGREGEREREIAIKQSRGMYGSRGVERDQKQGEREPSPPINSHFQCQISFRMREVIVLSFTM